MDADRNVVCGEIWALAHKHLELPEISVLFVEGLSPDQINAYRLGWQRLPELGAWDDEALGELFTDWSNRDIGFDIELPGFAAPEIENFIGAVNAGGATGDAPLEPADFGPAVTQPNDMWRCGNDHLIFCGSSTDEDSFLQLLKKQKAAAIVTDPPYNVAVDGHVGGKGKIRHPEFAMASGEMTNDEFTEFLTSFMRHCASFSTDGSLHYLFMDWRHTREILQAAAAVYTELKNIAVWKKSNAGMGSLYRSQHEFAFIFKSGKGGHRNNVQLGRIRPQSE